MRQQYGLRIDSEEFRAMPWREFADLLGGLNESTALVRVASIRTESDPEAIRGFSREQRAMRAEWQRRRAQSRPAEETEAFLAQMSQAMSRMFGGGYGS